MKQTKNRDHQATNRTKRAKDPDKAGASGKQFGEKRKFSIQPMIPVIILLGLGGLCGVAIGRLVKTMEDAGATRGELPLTCGLMLLGLYVVLLVQIVIHEAGHMLAGWASGYRFSSFRIGSLMCVRQSGELRIRRLSLAGTGGQCLMNPPEYRDGRIPVTRYNLGGFLANLLTVPVFWWLSSLTAGTPLLSMILGMFALIGFGFALINGIPLRLASVDNDGRNVITLLQDPNGMHAFWLQMRVNAMMAEGHRQKDLPADWFTMPDDADLNNSMIAARAVLCIGRMIDSHDFRQAEQTIASVLEKSNAMAGIHRLLLNGESIFLELLGQGRPERISALRTKEFEKFAKTMRNYPTILRMQYGLALLIEKDAVKAAAIRKQIDKVLASYPYPGEAAAERELLALLDEKAGQVDMQEETAI